MMKLFDTRVETLRIEPSADMDEFIRSLQARKTAMIERLMGRVVELEIDEAWSARAERRSWEQRNAASHALILGLAAYDGWANGDGDDACPYVRIRARARGEFGTRKT